MTHRKTFEIIAKAMKEVKPESNKATGIQIALEVTWVNCCKSLAKGLEETNLKFNEDRFFEACGYYGN